MPATIRLATEADASQVLAIYAPFCGDSAVSFETSPPTLDEMRRRVARTLEILPWLVVEERGRVLAYAYAGRHNERAAYVWSVNVSVYVREGRRRSGFGLALYTSLFALLKLQGFYNAAAGITLPNPGSVGLHLRMGFKPVGVYPGIGYKCGAWHDVLWLQRALRDLTLDPHPPLDFAVARKSPRWEEALAEGIALLR